MGFTDAASIRTADFNTVFIIILNFNRLSRFNINIGTISKLNTFNIVQIILTDFNFLLLEIELTLLIADPLAETIHINS